MCYHALSVFNQVIQSKPGFVLKDLELEIQIVEHLNQKKFRRKRYRGSSTRTIHEYEGELRFNVSGTQFILS